MTNNLSDYNNSFLDLSEKLPERFRTKTMTSLMNNLFNRFLTKDESSHVIGWVGDRIGSSYYIDHADNDRSLNALQPVFYLEYGNTQVVTTFAEILRKLQMIGVNIYDYARWGKTASYNFVPPIDLDKFCNFTKYRWYGHLVTQSGVMPWNPNKNPEYYVMKPGFQVNDWVATNYWVHEDDVATLGYNINSTVQATRPIIEYAADLELNTRFDATGIPVILDGTGVTTYAQTKTEFNQKPLFNLYRMDGTYSGKVSPIIYYDEDSSAPVDSDLQIRAVINTFSDYMFEIGVSDNENRLYMYKTLGNNSLQTIWKTGSDTGPVTYFVPEFFNTDSQGNLVSTTPTGTDADSTGAWKTPDPIFYNTEHEVRKQISYGDLYAHFITIIKAQPDLTGNPYGSNNFRTLTPYYGMGGTIKDFKGNLGIFIGLMSQEDVTPVTLLKFAEYQYEQLINAVNEFVTQNIADYIVDTGVEFSGVLSNTLDPAYDTLQLKFREAVALRNDYNVFIDTTSGIVGWPSSLPRFGMMMPTVPTIEFDMKLGYNVIKHHDGHVTKVPDDRPDLMANIAAEQRLRSDGSKTQGTIGQDLPIRPYKNQFWYDPVARILKSFDVISDQSVAPSGAAAGDFWYSRSTDTLYQYDGAAWNTRPAEMAWKKISISNIFASLLLSLEQRLYRQVGFFTTFGTSLLKWNAAQYESLMTDQYNALLENQFAQFASKYNQDAYGTDFLPSDAFTWNYHNATIPGVAQGTARWYDIYEQYYGTPRPNLEPWKLQGYLTEPSWWSDMYSGVSKPSPGLNYATGLYVQEVPSVVWDITHNYGYEPIVRVFDEDGYQIWPDGVDHVSEDRVKITFTSARTGVAKLLLTLEASQSQGAGRMWTDQMWYDIRHNTTPGHPAPTGAWTKPFSVNTQSDELLPPYVSPTSSLSSEAILTSIPAGASDRYTFGENGPIELIWRKSIEFNYDNVIVSFLLDPINFVEKTWGHNPTVMSTNGYDVDRTYHRKDSHTNMVLHGELINRDAFFSGDQHVQVTENMFDSTSFFELQLLYVYPTATAFSGIFALRKNNTIVAYMMGNSGIYVEGSNAISFRFYDGAYDMLVGTKISIVGTSTNMTIPTTKPMLGLCQWYVNLNRYNSVDTTISKNNSLLRNWTAKLGYRVGGLLDTQALTMRSDTFDLISADHTFVIKNNKYVADSWLDAIRVQVGRTGAMKMQKGLSAPDHQGQDWIFKIQTFNPKHPSIKYYELDTTGPYTTFNAFDGVNVTDAYKKFTNTLSVKEIPTPFVIRGIQNLVNFIFGYVAKLEEDGWQFSSFEDSRIDPATGRYVDWQFYIEKFLNALYTGAKPGDALLMNPFAQKVWFNTPSGVVSGFTNKSFIDGSASQYVYDILGRSIRPERMRILREDKQTKFISDVPMAGMHLLLDKYEHVVIFDDYSGDITASHLLYDGFLGLRIPRLYMDIIRQSEFTGRLSFGGYYIQGNEVKKNIEQSVKGLQNFYDFDNMYYGSESQNAATGLLGFTRKSYMDDLDIPLKSQFGYWKGLVSNKGSNFSLTAFLNSARFIDAKLDEFWAYKVADYGDARILKFPEIKISVDDANEKAMKLQFLDDGDTLNPGFIGITKDDDDRWFSLDDIKDSRYYFEAEVLGYVEFDNIMPGILYDLRDENGKEIFTDHLELYLKSDLNKNLLTTGSDYDYVNASTVRFRDSMAGQTVVARCWGPARPEFNPAKLIDYQDKVIASDIQLWDPARGAHTFSAAGNIDVTGENDPARYNYSTKIVSNKSYDPLRSWDSDQVGKVWWKTDNLGYIPYFDRKIYPNIDARIATWGSIADWASVDVYQWTESTVSPADYESQTGVTGRASLKDVYFRERSWTSTPIAWKYADFPESAPRNFTASGEARIKLTNHDLGDAVAILSENRWSTFGLTTGSQFAGMNSYDQPFGTAQITGSEGYIIGSSSDYFSADMMAGTFLSNLHVVGSTTSNSLGNTIGPIVFSSETVGSDLYIRATSMLTSLSQSVKIVDTPNLQGAQVAMNFYELGVMIVGNTMYDWTQTGYTTTAQRIAAVAADFGNVNHDVIVRTQVPVTIIDPFVLDGAAVDELNAIGDGLSTYWAAWNQPTAADIAADLLAPKNKWEPVYGVGTVVNAGPFIVNLIKSEISNPLVTSDGTQIKKYSYQWGDWNVLKDDVREVKFDKSSSFYATNFTYTTDQLKKRINVYVNGSIVNVSDWKIVNNAVTITKNVNLGDKVRVIVRKYVPTSDDLAFNPDLLPDFDDPSKTIQYKEDYQYTVREIRDENGRVTKTLYYFWVSDKTVAEGNKTLSIKNVAQQLRNNTNPFAIFASFTPQGPLPYRYKAFVTIGLNRFVTRDNFYKLRFTNNFILRDDPNEMDLKNKHAEWSLMRRAQLTKIPKKLWDKLTDTIVGSDAFGNSVPSLERRTYDLKHSTNSRFGFEDDQALLDKDQAIETIKYTILNTQLVVENTGHTDYIEFLDLTSIDSYFADAATTRETMTRIYNEAKGRQINEIMFNVLEDMLTSNYEMTDIFKTSFIAAYSIRTLNSSIA